MKIIVTAGGTGGHIYPALSVIKKFQEKEKDLEVLYIGTHNRMEKDIVPSLGIKYESLEIYGFTKDIKRDIKNISLIHKATKKSIKILKEFQPDIVIGFGGYVTFPVIKAAHKLGIKIFIHEQNSIPGKSNKVLAKYCDVIGVTFATTKKYFKHDHVIYTGHPRSDEAILATPIDKQTLGFSSSKKLVVIVLGSLGSSSLNVKIKEYLEQIDKENYEVLYITGKSQFEKYNNVTLPNNVKILPFYENLIGIFKNTDVVISRAGSGVLNEIIALNLPSIIIPSPNVANNHQYYNAKDLEDKKACIMLKEDTLTAIDLKNNVDKLLNDSAFKEVLISNLKKCKVQNSTDIIYTTIKDLMKK